MKNSANTLQPRRMSQAALVAVEDKGNVGGAVASTSGSEYSPGYTPTTLDVGNPKKKKKKASKTKKTFQKTHLLKINLTCYGENMPLK